MMIIDVFTGILFIMKVLCVLAFVCTACLCTDSYIQLRYYLWNREDRLNDDDQDELNEIEQYDSDFFDMEK